MNEPDIRVSPEKMHALGVRVLTKIGVPEDHARMTVDVLLCSDLRGIESHGFARFAAYYVELPRQGRIKIDPDVRGVQDPPPAPPARPPAPAPAPSASSPAPSPCASPWRRRRRPASAWSRCATAPTTAPHRRPPR